MILVRVRTALQQIATRSRCSLHAGVVTGCHEIGVEALRPVQQGAEFQVAVAVHARDRCTPGRILADKVRDDVVLELTLEIDDVMGDANDGGGPTRVVKVVECATAAETAHALALVVQLHRQADHLVTFLGEQGRGDR